MRFASSPTTPRPITTWASPWSRRVIFGRPSLITGSPTSSTRAAPNTGPGTRSCCRLSSQDHRKPDLLYIKFYWSSVVFVLRLCADLEVVRRVCVEHVVRICAGEPGGVAGPCLRLLLVVRAELRRLARLNAGLRS